MSQELTQQDTLIIEGEVQHVEAARGLLENKARDLATIIMLKRGVYDDHIVPTHYGLLINEARDAVMNGDLILEQSEDAQTVEEMVKTFVDSMIATFLPKEPEQELLDVIADNNKTILALQEQLARAQERKPVRSVEQKKPVVSVSERIALRRQLEKSGVSADRLAVFDRLAELDTAVEREKYESGMTNPRFLKIVANITGIALEKIGIPTSR